MRWSARSTLPVFLALGTIAALSGCDKQTGDSKTGQSTTGTSASSSNQSSSSGAKRIVLLNNNDSEFWTAARSGIKSANEKLHLADVNITGLMEINDGTLEGQIQKLR